MGGLRHMIGAAAIAVALVTACGGSDEPASPDADAASSDDGSARPATDDPNDTPDAPAADVEGNASITIDGETAGFDTDVCDADPAVGTTASGVVTIDGEPAYVEISEWRGGGTVFVSVGMPTDPDLTTIEESLELGLISMWSLSFEMDDLSIVTDAALAGTGTFLKTMSLDGSTGDEVPGAFALDCS